MNVGDAGNAGINGLLLSILYSFHGVHECERTSMLCLFLCALRYP